MPLKRSRIGGSTPRRRICPISSKRSISPWSLVALPSGMTTSRPWELIPKYPLPHLATLYRPSESRCVQLLIPCRGEGPRETKVAQYRALSREPAVETGRESEKDRSRSEASPRSPGRARTAIPGGCAPQEGRRRRGNAVRSRRSERGEPRGH